MLVLRGESGDIFNEFIDLLDRPVSFYVFVFLNYFLELLFSVANAGLSLVSVVLRATAATFTRVVDILLPIIFTVRRCVFSLL